MNIKFSYLYRDGANYKNFNEIVFSNPNSRTIKEIEKLIIPRLIDGKWFYCKKWNIPDMHFAEFDYNDEIDHDWHEFENLAGSNENITELNSIEEFISLVMKPE